MNTRYPTKYSKFTLWQQNTYTNIFRCQTLQNLPKLGFLVLNYTVWQFWSVHEGIH
jgi:hypothetical protein